MESRLNKTWSVHALKDKASAGKRGSGGPESAEEVEPHLKRALKAGVLVAPDGSCAFQKACSSPQKPLLKGVSHAQGFYTAYYISQVQVRGLCSPHFEKTWRETRQSFSVAAGDNKAEGRLGAVKGNMRRLGVLGRWNGSSKKKRVQVLASAALHRMPGIGTILKACKQYRLALSRGQVKLPPRDSFSPDALPWLEA